MLFLGDSLTAGYGLDPEEAFPALIGRRLAANGLAVDVLNAGLSGDTSAGGLRRVRWVLRQPVTVMVLALGANDGLRGLDVGELENNLQEIIDVAREAVPDIRIVLAGMYAPPNLGSAYTAAFAAVYTGLAERNRIPLIPFLLEGVAGEQALNQQDGIHPTAEGQRKVADSVYPWIERTLRETRPAGDEQSPLTEDQAPVPLHGVIQQD